MEVNAPGGLGFGIGTLQGWAISFDDPEISYPAAFTWSPTTDMTNSNTLTPTVCPASTETYTLEATDANNCVIVTDAATVTVTACTNCSIDSLTVNTTPCDASGNYTTNGLIYFVNPPATGNLIIEDCNGIQQTIAVGAIASPQAYNLTGQTADGAACDITAYFSDDVTCTNTENYTAPASCDPCNIDSLTLLVGVCQAATSTYDINGNIYFANAPSSGTLTVTDCNGNNQVFNSPFTSPQAYSLTGLTADGAACDVTAVFSADVACTMTTNYNAPATCSVNPCNMDSIVLSQYGCINNTFTVETEVYFSDAPTTGTLTITIDDGTTTYDTIINPPFTSPASWTNSTIATGGGAYTVTATFSADPACNISFGGTAPNNCDCSAFIGTFTNDVDGSAATNNIQLCFGETFTMTNNGDYIAPGEATSPPITAYDPSAGYDPGIGYLLYSCPPTLGLIPSLDTNDVIEKDPCFVGGPFYGNSLSDINVGAIGAPFINSTAYFVPVTFYDTISGYYSF